MCVPILIQQIKVKTQVLILWQNEFCLKRHCAPDFLTCTELCMLKVNLTKMNLYVKFLEGKVIFKYCLILYNQIINRQNLFNIYQEIYKICYCFVHFPHMHWIHVYSKLLQFTNNFCENLLLRGSKMCSQTCYLCFFLGLK